MGRKVSLESPDLSFRCFPVVYLPVDEELPIAPRGGVGLRARIEGLCRPALDARVEDDEEEERYEAEDDVEGD
jgi:hypothetical protein